MFQCYVYNSWFSSIRVLAISMPCLGIWAPDMYFPFPLSINFLLSSQKYLYYFWRESVNVMILQFTIHDLWFKANSNFVIQFEFKKLGKHIGSKSYQDLIPRHKTKDHFCLNCSVCFQFNQLLILTEPALAVNTYLLLLPCSCLGFIVLWNSCFWCLNLSSICWYMINLR